MNFKVPFFCSFSQKIKNVLNGGIRTIYFDLQTVLCRGTVIIETVLPDNNVTAVVCQIHKSQSSLELNLKIVPSFNIAYPTGVLPEYVLFASNRQNMYHQISWKSYHKKAGFKLHNCNYTIRLVISPLVKKSGFCLK